MRKLLPLTLMALMAACGSSQAIELARDGEALVPIVSDGAEGIDAAVADLKRYLDATTGGEFALLGPDDERPDGPAIFIGPSHFIPREADADRSRWLLEQIVQI